MNTQERVPNNSDNSIENISRSKRLFGWLTFLFGLGVVIPPIIGMIRIVIEMVGIYGSVEALGASGTAVPGELPDDITIAFQTALWGMIISVLSLIPFIIFGMIYLIRSKSLRALIQQ